MGDPVRPTPTTNAEIVTVSGDARHSRDDRVAAEEPMEIRVLVPGGGLPKRHSIAVTMRTPGDDFELAAGFLFSEGIVGDADAVREIEYCRGGPAGEQFNVINVLLAPGTPFDPKRFTRNVYTSSSCGVCGKTSLDLVRTSCPAPPSGSQRLSAEFFLSLPEKLAGSQAHFHHTGGLHASALFDSAGRLLLAREDVGRHNALDKLVGRLLLDRRLPASDTVLLVSGRASFELVQKAAMAGIPILAAVGAPSSLAIEIAREFGMTLVGFLRDARFNIYTGKERIVE